MPQQTANQIPILEQNPFDVVLAPDPNAFSDAEKSRLEVLELAVAKGLGTFVDVALALAFIREDRLYRHHSTFENYCRERWDFGRAYTQRVLDASQVIGILPMGEIPVRPTNERQLRPLALLAEPADVRKAWQFAVQKAGTQPVTGKLVEASVHALIEAGAKRRTAQRKGTRKTPATITISLDDLQAIKTALLEMSKVVWKTPIQYELSMLISQIESRLP